MAWLRSSAANNCSIFSLGVSACISTRDKTSTSSRNRGIKSKQSLRSFGKADLTISVNNAMAPAYLHILCNRVSGLLIIFFAFLNIASSAVLAIPHGNLSIASAPNSNQCTDNSNWIGTGSTSADCIGAVQQLYNEEVKTFSDIDFEFLSAKAPARSLPAMRTPRKYTVGEFSQNLRIASHITLIYAYQS